MIESSETTHAFDIRIFVRGPAREEVLGPPGPRVDEEDEDDDKSNEEPTRGTSASFCRWVSGGLELGWSAASAIALPAVHGALGLIAIPGQRPIGDPMWIVVGFLGAPCEPLPQVGSHLHSAGAS